MPRVIRIGLDISQGHGWLPTTCDIPTGEHSVFINGVAAAMVGDLYNVAKHVPPPLQPPHVGMFALVGSNSVFFNGKPVHRDGDAISCGDAADNGSPSVFANGGGLGGPASNENPDETTGYVTLNPVITYPSILLTIKWVGDLESRIYKSGCPVDFNISEIYSPLQEETTNAKFKNYPGSPLSQIDGAPTLPKYAPNEFRSKIPIYGLKIDKALPDGITFNPSTGRISGALTEAGSLANEDTYRVSCENYVGSGSFIFKTRIILVAGCN